MQRQHDQYRRLLELCTSLPPTATAVAHRCDARSLPSLPGAAWLSLISPVLVWPKARIAILTRQLGIDLSGVAA